ncbi:MAG: DUF5906 domain-containing protein [Thermosphaera sp.]
MSQENTFSNPPIKPDGKEAGSEYVEEKTIDIKGINQRVATLFLKDRGILIRINRKDKLVVVAKIQGSRSEVINWRRLDEISDETAFTGDPALDQGIATAVQKLLREWDVWLNIVETERQAPLITQDDYKGSDVTITSSDEIVSFIVGRIKDAFTVAELTSGGVPIDIFCKKGPVWRPCRPTLESYIASLGTSLQPIGLKMSKQLVDRAIYIAGITSRREIEYKNYVAFNNRVLDVEKFIETGVIQDSLLDPTYVDVYHLIEHDIDINALIKTEGLGAYIPPKSCSDLLEIFKRIAPNTFSYFKGLVGEDRACFLAQLIGAMLYPSYKYKGAVSKPMKSFFVLIGPPNSGKSTFIVKYVGEVVLGKENFKTGNISRLTSSDPEDRLRELGDLFGTLMVVFPDVGKKTVVYDWSALTSITGGDPVKGRKLRENAFEYYPSYKLVFTTNSPPPLPHEEEIKRALIDRAKVIEFKNRFDDINPFSISPLKEEVERALIIYLYGLRLAFTHGYQPTGVSNIEDLWLRYQEPIYRLLMEMIEKGVLVKDPTSEIKTSDLYLEVQKYYQSSLCNGEEECEEEGGRFPAQDVFTKKLKEWAGLIGIRVVKKKGYNVVKGLTTAQAKMVKDWFTPQGVAEQ